MSRIMDLRCGDIIPQSPAGLCCGGCGCIVGSILIILFFPCTVTQLDQFQIGLVKNTVTGVVDLETTYTPGRYWIGFWKTFIEFPSTLNTIQFSDEEPEEGVQQLSALKSRDRDGKLVFLDITVQYYLMPEKLGLIYKEMTLQYEDVYISELRDALSKACNAFAIAEAWTSYDKVSNILKRKCIESLDARHAVCWGLQVWGIYLTDTYEGSLIKTEVQKQSQVTESFILQSADVRAKTRTRLAGYSGEITRIKGRTDAQMLQLERTAEATAQAALIQADADILDVIRNKVVFNGTSLANVTTSRPISELEDMRLSSAQLVAYKKAALLMLLKETPFIYRPFGAQGSTSDILATSR